MACGNYRIERVASATSMASRTLSIRLDGVGSSARCVAATSIPATQILAFLDSDSYLHEVVAPEEHLRDLRKR